MFDSIRIKKVAETGTYHDVVEEANKCINRGDREGYAYLYFTFIKRADPKDADTYLAYTTIGYIWEEGIGVPVNYLNAFDWYMRAATGGDILSDKDAIYKVGYFYEHGLAVSRDIDKAIYWYRKAAVFWGSFEAAQALKRLGISC